MLVEKVFVLQSLLLSASLSASEEPTLSPEVFWKVSCGGVC